MWGGSWFGGSGGQKRKEAPKKAILDLRQQLDMLQKREKHLENQMAEQEAIARKNVSSNKTGMCLLYTAFEERSRNFASCEAPSTEGWESTEALLSF